MDFVANQYDVSLLSIEGMLIVLFDLCVIGFVLTGLFVLVRYLFRVKSRRDFITLPNGHRYAVQLGDNLVRYDAGDTFRGIDIELPKAFPHLFLDSHRNDSFFGYSSRYFFKTSQRIKLEGDFSKDFQVYIPKGYQVLALSVLTPDVLKTLQDSSGRYDVELFDFRLRLISSKNVIGKPEREADITQAATKILAEIDHKLRSWSEPDSIKAVTKHLALEVNLTVKFGRQTMRLSSFVYGTIFLLLGLLFWTLAWWVWHEPDTRDGFWIIAGLAFALFPCAFFLFTFGYARGWLNWTKM